MSWPSDRSTPDHPTPDHWAPGHSTPGHRPVTRSPSDGPGMFSPPGPLAPPSPAAPAAAAGTLADPGPTSGSGLHGTVPVAGTHPAVTSAVGYPGIQVPAGVPASGDAAALPGAVPPSGAVPPPWAVHPSVPRPAPSSNPFVLASLLTGMLGPVLQLVGAATFFFAVTEYEDTWSFVGAILLLLGTLLGAAAIGLGGAALLRAARTGAPRPAGAVVGVSIGTVSVVGLLLVALVYLVIMLLTYDGGYVVY